MSTAQDGWRYHREPAFAKVNLGLQVLDSRPDGYHNLRTVFQSVDLADSVEVAVKPGEATAIELWCSRRDLNRPDNLAHRAVDLLLEQLGVSLRVRIRLEKRIPVGGGLGGGSSDAAAVLRSLWALLGGVSPESLGSVAGSLGSDVPYFLLGGTARGSGRGTDLVPLPDRPPRPVLLALPEISVSTAWAFRALDDARTARPAGGGTPQPEPGHASDAAGADLHNDFEGVVFDRFPALRRIKRAMLRSGARQALLSGSGSAIFGIFETRASTRHAARRLEQSGVPALASQFLPRASCGNVEALLSGHPGVQR